MVCMWPGRTRWGEVICKLPRGGGELGEATPALLAELNGTAGWSALQRLIGVGQAAARPALAVSVVNALAHMVTCELLEGATGMVPVAPPAKARHLRLAFI